VASAGAVLGAEGRAAVQTAVASADKDWAEAEAKDLAATVAAPRRGSAAIEELAAERKGLAGRNAARVILEARAEQVPETLEETRSMTRVSRSSIASSACHRMKGCII
jgi:hypothetical protein